MKNHLKSEEPSIYQYRSVQSMYFCELCQLCSHICRFPLLEKPVCQDESDNCSIHRRFLTCLTSISQNQKENYVSDVLFGVEFQEFTIRRLHVTADILKVMVGTSTKKLLEYIIFFNFPSVGRQHTSHFVLRHSDNQNQKNTSGSINCPRAPIPAYLRFSSLHLIPTKILLYCKCHFFGWIPQQILWIGYW